jgi:hypothetical protein
VRRIVSIALVTGALAATAGCGGGDGGGGGSGNTVSPEAWSAAVCSAVGGWATDLQTASESLSGAMSGATSVADVRERFVTFLETAIARSDQMLSEAEAAGQPDVEDGGEIADFLLDELRSFKTALEDARDQAEDLPDDPAGFTQGAQEIGASLEQVGEDAAKGFDELDDKYQSAELQQAFEDEPACQELQTA